MYLNGSSAVAHPICSFVSLCSPLISWSPANCLDYSLLLMHRHAMKGVVSVLKRLQKHAGEILEFPTDVLDNGPKITIIGRSEIIIEYFDEVVGFSDQEITLRTSEGKLCLNGDKFILTAVQDHEISIRGRLTGLSFGEG